MRTTTAAVATILSTIIPGFAFANAEDDYVACMIGRSALALYKQEKKDSDKAQAVAYKHCRKLEPKYGNEGGEGVSDYINMQVEKLAQ
jgi:hypothetical protein